MPWPWLVIIAIALLLFVASLWALKRFLRRPEPILPIQYSKKEPSVPFFIKPFDTDVIFNYKNPYLDGQSDAWRQGMARIGEVLDENNVTHAYFVHGTLVGDDPFGLIPALRRIHREMDPNTEFKIRQKIKRGYDHLTRDTGNYLEEYVDLFRLASGARTQCQIFTWSSANHHLARLMGSIYLIERLAGDLPDIPVSRILLVGHSHGGQIFALFSHIINQTHLGNSLLDILEEHDRTGPAIRRAVAKLKKFSFDIATFGTPHRYPWRLTKRMRLINVINHRGKTHLAEKPLGFWKTAGGDYVQQWGIAGSDSLAQSSQDRKINREIDKLLGPGVDPKGWLENVAKGMRVQEFGTTYLVDYRDNGIMVPNFMKTVFGHGVYTRYEVMLFNAQLMCDEFYPDKRTKPQLKRKSAGNDNQIQSLPPPTKQEQ